MRNAMQRLRLIRSLRPARTDIQLHFVYIYIYSVNINCILCAPLYAMNISKQTQHTIFGFGNVYGAHSLKSAAIKSRAKKYAPLRRANSKHAHTHTNEKNVLIFS